MRHERSRKSEAKKAAEENVMWKKYVKMQLKQKFQSSFVQRNIFGQQVGLPECKGKRDKDEADIEESCFNPTSSTDKPPVSVHNVEEPVQGAQYRVIKRNCQL